MSNAGVDLYREVHKGLRLALFTVTEQAGRCDATNDEEVRALQASVANLVWMLNEHARHEDTAILPALHQHAAALAGKLEETHKVMDGRLAEIGGAGGALLSDGDRGGAVRGLYLALAAFTGDYLRHLGEEEEQAMPALTKAMSQEDLFGIQMKVRGAIKPEDMGRFFRFMIPAMNLGERAELLGGVKKFAPPPAFEAFRKMAEDLLPAADYKALAARIGV